MDRTIKKIIYCLWLFILLLPCVQQQWQVFKIGKLDGYFTNARKETFSFAKWWGGKYQAATNDYVNDHIGFRQSFIRLNNQLNYSLYRKIHPQWAVEGKDKFLFIKMFISSYYGDDYSGYDSICTKLRKLKAIQDTLEKLGKTVVLIHAPDKASYYPEYLPDSLKEPVKRPTNYETFVRVGDSLGIHQLDLNKWYIGLKNRASELLYPRQAFHWSIYGSLLAADSLVKYIERKRKIVMPHPNWTKIVHTKTPRYDDDDIARDFDLIFPVARETFSYPEVHYTTPADVIATRPKVIYIGDSFLMSWVYDDLMDNTNSEWQIWYYFNFILDKNHREQTPNAPPQQYVANTDWIDRLKNTDCLIIMYTGRNLKDIGRGFIEQAYAYFYPGEK